MSSAVAELENYLQSMLALKPPGVSGTKIQGITALCTANVQVRKNHVETIDARSDENDSEIVIIQTRNPLRLTKACFSQNESVLIQKIYTHFKKTPGTHKLGVLYVVDSVTRQWVEAARKAGQPSGSEAPDGTFAAGVNRVTELLPVLMTDIINNAPNDQKVRSLNTFALAPGCCTMHSSSYIPLFVHICTVYALDLQVMARSWSASGRVQFGGQVPSPAVSWSLRLVLPGNQPQCPEWGCLFWLYRTAYLLASFAHTFISL